MKRRHFCQSAVATGVASAFPLGRVLALTVASDIPAVTLSGDQTVLEEAVVKEFAESLKGELLAKGDPGYDQARTIWNAMHDRHPALIARCAHIEDVSKSVNFAREQNLLLAIKGYRKPPRTSRWGRATKRFGPSHSGPRVSRHHGRRLPHWSGGTDIGRRLRPTQS